MLAIGLTGCIGTGKSIVCHIFSELGACVLNADKMANRITDTNREVIQQIKAHFGEHFYPPTGGLDRRKLGKFVFSNNSELQKLNRIVHPHLVNEIHSEIQKWRIAQTVPLLIIEIAILYELKLEKEFDQVVVISTPIEVVLERLKRRDKIPQNEIMNRIQSQIPQKLKKNRADIIIDNSSNISDLRKKVEKIYQILIQKNTEKI